VHAKSKGQIPHLYIPHGTHMFGVEIESPLYPDGQVLTQIVEPVELSMKKLGLQSVQLELVGQVAQLAIPQITQDIVNKSPI
jgi:hypothetical protein